MLFIIQNNSSPCYLLYRINNSSPCYLLYRITPVHVIYYTKITPVDIIYCIIFFPVFLVVDVEIVIICQSESVYDKHNNTSPCFYYTE